MKRNLRRLFLALVFSTGCFVGSIWWYESGRQESRAINHKPVARLNGSNNEVQRKPTKRVIWESVSKNDELYPGEAIRTAPNADANLFFMKSGTTVHLEPDSLIVLEESDKGVTLDFLSGNMFVQSTGAASDGFTLKSGNGEIKLKSADMSLSKSQNGNVNLEVHRGEAELEQGLKKTALNKENSAVLSSNGVSVANDRMQVLRPQAGETLYLNLTRGEKIDLAWKPLPAVYKVSVEIGDDRNTLSPVTGVTAAGESGALGISHKPGHWFLKVIAKSTDPKLPPLASNVIPFVIEPKSPPSLVEPRPDTVMVKPTGDMPVVFKWIDRNKFESHVLEVATDAQFKKIKLHENLAADSGLFSTNLNEGTYFWRVTGFLRHGEKTESLSSSPAKFSVMAKFEIAPPILTTPVNDIRLSFYETSKNGVGLRWLAPRGVESFKVNVEQKTAEGWKTAFKQDMEVPQTRISELPAGNYRWTVASIDPKGGEPKVSQPFNFTIEDMLKIEWVDASPGNTYIYSTPTPSIRSNWKPLPAPLALYRYKIAPVGKPMESEIFHTTRQTLFDIPVPADGKYQVIVEAVGTKGQLLAQSSIKEIEVKSRPLLPAPQWAFNTPPILQADGKGSLTFAWQQVEGAAKYLMILETDDGKVLEQKEISRTTASFNRLKPGQYQVHLKSVDELRRPGLDGEKRKLEVPNTSDIRAPKFKAMKVK